MTLATIALLNLVSRSKQVAFGTVPTGGVPHPLRALTARLARDLAAERGTGIPGPAEAARDITDEFLELLPALRRLPRRLDQLGQLAERGELALTVRLFTDRRDAAQLERLTDRLLLAFFSASVGLVSALLLAFPAGPLVAGTTRLDQVIGYAGLTAATILGLRVLATIGRHQQGR